ncbi:MAG: hypothetical protein ACYC3I_09955 [Gemmataceae bacterium]
MLKIYIRILLYAGLILPALAAAGCAKNSAPPEDKAEKAVEQLLDAWNRGEPADKFADPNNPISGSDPDWKAGYRLLSFLSSEIKQSQEKPDEFRCQVELSLQDKSGKRWDKKVTYEVRLGEKSVVNRASP